MKLGKGHHNGSLNRRTLVAALKRKSHQILSQGDIILLKARNKVRNGRKGLKTAMNGARTREGLIVPLHMDWSAKRARNMEKWWHTAMRRLGAAMGLLGRRKTMRMRLQGLATTRKGCLQGFTVGAIVAVLGKGSWMETRAILGNEQLGLKIETGRAQTSVLGKNKVG